MVNLNAAIRQVRRARHPLDAPSSRRFDRYRSEYEAILEATAGLAGDPAFDDLKQWMIETTTESGRLPTPAEVRRRAREVCSAHDVSVPRNSPLRE